MQAFRYFLFIVICFFISGCDEYGAAGNIDFSILNDSIRAANRQGLLWAMKPETIAKNLFPSDAHPEGNPIYTVQSEYNGDNHCTVTIINEGAMDDELNGERRVVKFERSKNIWLITAMTMGLKRRL
jgi:hypothetical protein